MIFCPPAGFRRLTCLAAALLFTALSGLASAEELMSAKDFSNAYMEAVRKTDPSLTFRRTDDEGFIVKHADGTETRVYTGNAYRDYRAAPDTRDEIIARHVRNMFQVVPETGDIKLSANMIVPAVRTNAYLEELGRYASEGKKPELVFDRLTPELIVVYMFDFPERLLTMLEEHLDEVKVERSELWELAKANLRRLYGQDLQVKGDKGFYYFEAGGVFDSSMLLLDIWTQQNFPVKGDIVAFIPARNYLMVTGSEDEEGLALARKVSSQVVAEEAYPITKQGLVWRDGKWLPFKN